MALAKSALAIAAAVIATTVWAEGPMPEELAWKLLELGQVIDLPKTAAIYAPLQENEPYQGVKIDDTRLTDEILNFEGKMPGAAEPQKLEIVDSVICIGRYFSASRDRDWHRQKAAVWPLHPPRRRPQARHRFAAAPRRDWSRRRRNRDCP